MSHFYISLLNFILAIVSFILKPFFAFAIGFIVGLFIELFLGNTIVACLSWFQIIIDPSQIPICFAVLSMIASFFKSTDTYYLDDDDEE